MKQSSFTIDFLSQPYKVCFITTRTAAVKAVDSLMRKECVFGLDIETCATEKFLNDHTAPLCPFKGRIRTVQVCDGKNVAVFDLFSIGNPSFLKHFFATKTFVAHNAMFELQFLTRAGVPVMNIHCSLIAAKLIAEAVYAHDVDCSLGGAVKNILKTEIWKDIDQSQWGAGELSFEQVQYAAFDAVAARDLLMRLVAGLTRFSMGNVYKLYRQAQIPLTKMRLNGMKLNVPLHTTLVDRWRRETYAAKKELTAITRLDDLTAHTMADYLERTLPKDVLALWPRTETNKISTSADTFSDFSWVDIVRPFSKFQKASTLCSTFGMKLQHKISDVTGRIHSRYKVNGARTGRLSSSDPNLQNMPHDPEFRSCFIADEGKVLVVADLNQIELRIAAECSKDPEMQRAYRSGIDLHAVTAAKVSGDKLEKLDKEGRKAARQRAKAFNFGLLYGMGAAKFAHYAKKGYGVEVSTAQAIDSVDRWKDLYRGYVDWHQREAAECENTLHTKTRVGKVRKLTRDNYYGASANTPVQGTAAEVMLKWLCNLNERLGASETLVNTVHDEVAIECINSPPIILAVRDCLEQSAKDAYEDIFPGGLSRGLVEVGYGENWAKAKS